MVAACEKIHGGTRITVEQVAPGASVNVIGAAASVDHVVAGVTDERVPGVGAEDLDALRHDRLERGPDVEREVVESDVRQAGDAVQVSAETRVIDDAADRARFEWVVRKCSSVLEAA